MTYTKSHIYKLTAGLVAIVLMTSMIGPAYSSLLPGPMTPFTGNVGVSSDGCGTNTPPCTILQDVPAGGTVLKAFLYATTTGSNPATVTVSLDGTNVVMSPLAHNEAPSSLGTYFADVTAQISGDLPNVAKTYPLDDSIGQSTGSIDGAALVIVYSDPSLQSGSVLIFDGGLPAAPNQQILFFGAPVDTTVPGFFAEMRLGIGFSAQDQSGPAGLTHCGGDSQMDSQIDVNTVRLTSCAGNQDDGVGSVANGLLFTMGGVGDDLLNPADPFQRAGLGAASEAIDDDERYDITSFITNGDTQLVLDTVNTSADDNLFITIIYVRGATVTVDPPEPDMVAGEIMPLDTTALLIGGLFANTLWMAPVLGGAAVATAAFYIKSRKN